MTTRDGLPLNEWHWSVYPATKRVVGGKATPTATGPCVNVANGRCLAEIAAGLRTTTHADVGGSSLQAAITTTTPPASGPHDCAGQR